MKEDQGTEQAHGVFDNRQYTLSEVEREMTPGMWMVKKRGSFIIVMPEEAYQELDRDRHLWTERMLKLAGQGKLSCCCCGSKITLDNICMGVRFNTWLTILLHPLFPWGLTRAYCDRPYCVYMGAVKETRFMYLSGREAAERIPIGRAKAPF